MIGRTDLLNFARWIVMHEAVPFGYHAGYGVRTATLSVVASVWHWFAAIAGPSCTTILTLANATDLFDNAYVFALTWRLIATDYISITSTGLSRWQGGAAEHRTSVFRTACANGSVQNWRHIVHLKRRDHIETQINKSAVQQIKMVNQVAARRIRMEPAWPAELCKFTDRSPVPSKGEASVPAALGMRSM